MTTDFDSLLAERTKKGDPTVQGVLVKCVDKNGWCRPPPPPRAIHRLDLQSADWRATQAKNYTARSRATTPCPTMLRRSVKMLCSNWEVRQNS